MLKGMINSIILAGFFVAFSINANAFSGGAGTEEDPWQIGTAEDLMIIDSNDLLLDMHYIMVADVNMAGYEFSTAVIAPDLNSSNNDYDGIPFTGTFDGNGNVIYNLKIEGHGYLGLFGQIEGSDAEIKNLSIEDFEITGTKNDGKYFGALCGFNGGHSYEGGVIINCHASGEVTGGEDCSYVGLLCGSCSDVTDCTVNGKINAGDNSSYIGGLCGANYGKILNCQAVCTITGRGVISLGGLLGYNFDSGTLINCASSGEISCSGNSIGGLCGGVGYQSRISRCYSTSQVNGERMQYAGGLCGYNDGIITHCYATGDVTGEGSRELGGLCGENGYRIRDCYATGNITGSRSIGGLCGSSYYSLMDSFASGSVSSGPNSQDIGGLCGLGEQNISNCYSTGAVTSGSSSQYVAGLCGRVIYDYSTIRNCFWDIETSGLSTGYHLDPNDPVMINNVQGRNTSEMKAVSNYTAAGWDFVAETTNGTNEVWQLPVGGGYPILTSLNDYTPVELAGDGSKDNPYLINNADELGAIYHYEADACYKLAADIDLGGIQWSRAVIPFFRGCFDGNGHVISNLKIKGFADLGLFEWIEESEAKVEKLGIKDYSIEGYRYLGGLCAVNEGRITLCYTIGNIVGTVFSDHLGGLCGLNKMATIDNCYSNVDITGKDHSASLGGLCGENTGSITGTYAKGNVKSGNTSYNTGGLCGQNYFGSDISSSYSTGLVVSGADSKHTGGLCGKDYGVVTNSFWDIETSGQVISDGGTGKTTAEMQDMITFADAGWDFEGDWWINDGRDYPRLAWQPFGDVNNDCRVDAVDLGLMGASWMSSEGEAGFNGVCELSGDDVIGMDDLSIIIEAWLEGPQYKE